MTAISPCPLATNITATAFISKNIGSKRKVLLSGILYSLGRAFSYTVIGFVLYFGASKFHLQRFFNQNGEKYLGPLLIIIGLIMPLFGILVMYFLKFQGQSLDTFFHVLLREHDVTAKVLSLSIIANIIPFIFYTNKRLDLTATGVLIATVLYAVLIVLFKFACN